jgi:hypothetical protein
MALLYKNISAFFLVLAFCAAIGQETHYGSVPEKNQCDSLASELEHKILRFRRSMNVLSADTANIAANDSVTEAIKLLLSLPCSFMLPFDTLSQNISVLKSPDNKFRIFNWHMVLRGGRYSYYGFIITDTGNGHTLHSLTDSKPEIKDASREVLHPEKWYGCLYYEILKNTHSRKTYYTLLGWDGNDLFTNKKLIEVLSFTEEGNPVFGASPMFDKPDDSFRRIFFEYSQQSSMTLAYNKNKKMIVFDHLSPSRPAYRGHADYYGADFSYDAYEFEDGKWMLRQDIDARNPKPENKPKQRRR